MTWPRIFRPHSKPTLCTTYTGSSHRGPPQKDETTLSMRYTNDCRNRVRVALRMASPFSTHGRKIGTETQTTAGRWRSLTRTYVVPTYRSSANTLTSATMAGLSDVVVAAGCLKTAAAARVVVESKFEDRISFILSTAGNFSKIVGEIISADFNVFVVRPVEKFDGTMMEVDKGQRIPSRTAMNQKVLSSTHIGLTKRIRLESGREDTSTVVKAKVVLESLLDS